ncbi:hypothetical protein V494_06090 [Pseudogymnoascus sp. VKM F-4513 (FW-928)]|nr:hypothetical protein V494_06090 [Pseudogymnoascus sp. VKM F-4513 (FW-928)]
MDVPVWLRSEAALLPLNVTLVRNAAVLLVTALKAVVPRLALVGPRQEQSNMATSAAGARAKSPNKVSGLEVVPSDLRTDLPKVDGRVSWRGSVEGHGDETRAVGAVLGTFWVWVRACHGVCDVAINPVSTAGDDFLAGNLAVHLGVASSAAAAGIAILLDNPSIAARLHVVVCDVAAVLCLVPEVVTGDGFANGLAGNLNIVALLVCLDDFVAGGRTRAAVDGCASDGVCADQGGHESGG